MIVSLLLYLLVIRSMALSPRQERPTTSMVMIMDMAYDGYGDRRFHSEVMIRMTVMMMMTVIFMITVYGHRVRDI
jgi:hypothetical protein